MPSPYNPDKHDLGILRTDGVTNVGFMLLRDKNGVPIYQEFDDEYLAAQIFTGTPGYSNLPPEKELAIRQDDWRSGYGLEYFDAEDPKRYYESVGMDLRFRSMGILGPTVQKLANIAIPTDVIIPNNGGETASVNWTNGQRSTDYAKAGASSWQVAQGSWGGNAYQDILAGWASNVNVGFTCWMRDDGGAGVYSKIAVEDGVTTTESASVVGATFTEKTAWHKVAANANMLRLHLRVLNTVGSSFFDQASLSFLGTVNVGVSRAFAEFNDKLYISKDNILAKMQANGNGLDLIQSLPANITALEPFTDDQLYIGLGSTNYRVMNTAGWIKGSTDAAVINAASFFKTVHSGSPTMWAGNSPNKIRSSTDPANAALWSGITNVGSSYHEITGLLSRSAALYIMKEDMPYYLNSSGAVQNDLAPELASLLAAESGKNALLWLDKLYVPCGTQGLMETDGTTNTWRNPSKHSSNNANYIGRIMALAADEEYLFAIMKNASSPFIFAGRLETIGSTTQWVWHPIQQFTQTNTETMFATSLVKKRLYIASTVSNEGISFVDLPTGYGNITSDANRNFANSGYFWTPWLHGEFKDTKKVFTELSVVLGHAYNANVGFVPNFQLFGASGTNFFVDNHTFYGTASNRTDTAYFPANSSSEMVRLYFRGANGGHLDKTPILSSYRLKSILYPPKRTIIACTVVASQEQLLKDGTVDKGSYETQKTVLDEAMEATWPVTIYDIDGVARTVKFLPLPGNIPRFAVVRSEKGRKQERHYNLLPQEVKLS